MELMRQGGWYLRRRDGFGVGLLRCAKAACCAGGGWWRAPRAWLSIADRRDHGLLDQAFRLA
jgi:hypothetical protein